MPTIVQNENDIDPYSKIDNGVQRNVIFTEDWQQIKRYVKFNVLEFADAHDNFLYARRRKTKATRLKAIESITLKYVSHCNGE